MKICVLGTRGFPEIPGGIERHCEKLYPKLVEMGYTVTVLGRSPYVGQEPYKYQGVNILPIPCPKNKYLEAICHTCIGILKARSMNADLLHIHAVGPSLFAPLARLLGLKVIMTHHGPDYERKKWNALARTVLRLGESAGVNFSHKTIAISRTIHASIRREYSRDAAVIPNGVDISPRMEQVDALQQFRLKPNRYILAVGRFVPEKGFHDLLEAFQHFSRNQEKTEDPYELVIVGDADHSDEYSRRLKEDCQKVPHVVLTGFQGGDALKQLYSHAALFVLPSYHEGLPIVLLEALSYGHSCVVSDIPANREVQLADERYFAAGDIEELAKKLQQFLEQPLTPEDRQEQIQAILQHYDWTMIATETFKIYNEVLYSRIYQGEYVKNAHENAPRANAYRA